MNALHRLSPRGQEQIGSARYGTGTIGLGAVRARYSEGVSRFIFDATIRGKGPAKLAPAKLAKTAGTNQAANNGGHQMTRNSTRVRGENFSPTKKFTPVTEQEAAQQFSAEIILFSVGELAQATGRSKDTVKCWKSGRAFPNGVSLMALMAEFPRIEAWVRSKTHGFQAPVALGTAFALLEQAMQADSAEGRAMRARFTEILREKS